jgi:CRP/FNR family transcriptional regulator
MKQDWTLAVPGLRALEPESLDYLRAQSRQASFPPGTVLFGEGGACQNYLFVLTGSVRVQKLGETGREIVLYRVERGETCVLTTACLMAETDYDAEGITETEVEAVVVPASVFNELLARSAKFRRFVFATYANRIADLLMLIEEVAFGRIDARLAHCLLSQKDELNHVKGTHQELSSELGTAREVISRQLKEFERRGWAKLGRGKIELTDIKALATLAGGK